MKKRAVEDDADVFSRKKRKFLPHLKNELDENFVSPTESWTSGTYELDESSDDVKECSRVPDLENVDLQSEEIYTSMSSSFRAAATSTKEHSGDSEELMIFSAHYIGMKKLSLPPWIPRRRVSYVREKMPSTAEIEDFFAAAEKYEQERFIEKYNYDVVEDVPLEGKYQWIRIQP